MKLLATSVLTLVLSLSASAQGVKINVPFAFELGDSTLPAGQYVISSEQGQRMLVVRAANENRSVVSIVAPTHPGIGEPMHKVVVTFNKYGDRYFLGDVWAHGVGNAVPQSRAERELGAARASLGVKPEVVTLSGQIN